MESSKRVRGGFGKLFDASCERERAADHEGHCIFGK